MTEDRDPFIQSLFAEDQQTLPGDEFVNAVMARTTRLKRNLYLSCLAAVCALLLLSWALSWPLVDIALAFSQVLGTEIIVIGDSLLALLLLPINNLATLLVIIWRIARYGWLHATEGSYSS